MKNMDQNLPEVNDTTAAEAAVTENTPAPETTSPETTAPHAAPVPPVGTAVPPHGAPVPPAGAAVPPRIAFIPPRPAMAAPAPNGIPYTAYNPYAGGYAQFTPPEKKKRRVWPIILWSVLGFIGFLALAVGAALLGSSMTSNSDFTSLPKNTDSYVAVVYIDSEIAGDYVTTSLYGSSTSYNQVFYIDTIYELIDDPSNAGIMLYINSPGGEVTATDELSRAIVEYKEETGRPVYAYFSDMAASGAYWIGCHADKIIASRFCTTGSIGVTYGTHIEISRLLDELGITVTELTAGDNKAMGSMYSPLTEEQKAMYEEQLAEMHELFIDVVAENRGLDEAKVREIADGRTFLASKALEYGLIDGIGYYDYAQYSMIVDCNLAENVTFYDFVPQVQPQNSLIYYLESLIPEKNTSADDAAITALVEELNRGRRFMAIYR